MESVAAIAAAAHTAIIPQRKLPGEHERRQQQRPIQVGVGPVGGPGLQRIGDADPASAQDLLSVASVPVERKRLILALRAHEFDSSAELAARQIGSITIAVIGMCSIAPLNVSSFACREHFAWPTTPTSKVEAFVSA